MTVENLFETYRDWMRRSKAIEVEGVKLKLEVEKFLGSEDALLLGERDGMRYVAAWRKRDNRKLDMRLVTAIVRAKGALTEEITEAVVREDAVEALVDAKVLGPDDLKACLTGTISRYVQVTPLKSPEETA